MRSPRVALPPLALLTPLSLVLLGGTARAQGAVPSAHFGRDVYPRSQPETRLAFSTDRFTEFEDANRRFSTKYAFTTGFNFLTLQVTDHVLGNSQATYTLTVSPGWSSDEPSRWLQNSYLHGLRKLPEVPVGDTRNEAEYALGGEVNWWLDEVGDRRSVVQPPVVVGMGMASSTVFSELYVHAGVAAQPFDLWTHRVVVRGLVRQSWPREGDAFRAVASDTTLWQGTLELVPREIHEPGFLWRYLGNPAVGFTLSQDSGVFEDGGDDPIEIQFMSFHVQWATGLRIETYNDLPNDTDMGPSFGLAVSIDVSTLLGATTWPW